MAVYDREGAVHARGGPDVKISQVTSRVALRAKVQRLKRQGIKRQRQGQGHRKGGTQSQMLKPSMRNRSKEIARSAETGDTRAQCRQRAAAEAACSLQKGKGGVAEVTPADDTVTIACTVAAAFHYEDHGWVYMVARVCQERGLLLMVSGACLLVFGAGWRDELAADDKSTQFDVQGKKLPQGGRRKLGGWS